MSERTGCALPLPASVFAEMSNWTTLPSPLKGQATLDKVPLVWGTLGERSKGSGESFLRSFTYKGHPARSPQAACGPTRNCKFTQNIMRIFLLLLVFEYLMRGPRQLFFVRCGPETPNGGFSRNSLLLP